MTIGLFYNESLGLIMRSHHYQAALWNVFGLAVNLSVQKSKVEESLYVLYGTVIRNAILKSNSQKPRSHNENSVINNKWLSKAGA